MEPRNVTDETLSEQELTHVTGGAEFQLVPGSRLKAFGKKPVHMMSPMQEENNHIIPTEMRVEEMKTGKIAALGIVALPIGAAAIAAAIYQARKNT